MCRRSFFVSICVVLIIASCTTTREFRGRLLDVEGKAVPGSLLYTESYVPGKGPVDFAYVEVDPEGYVPPRDTAPLRLRWRRGAYLVIAVLAPAGTESFVVLDRTHYYDTRDLLFDLHDTPRDWDGCIQRLAGIGWPFENTPNLAARLNKPANASLCKAFLRIWEPILSGACPPLPHEQAKLHAVRRLKQDFAQ